jgi:hypothetical protein
VENKMNLRGDPLAKQMDPVFTEYIGEINTRLTTRLANFYMHLLQRGGRRLKERRSGGNNIMGLAKERHILHVCGSCIPSAYYII